MRCLVGKICDFNFNPIPPFSCSLLFKFRSTHHANSINTSGGGAERRHGFGDDGPSSGEKGSSSRCRKEGRGSSAGEKGRPSGNWKESRTSPGGGKESRQRDGRIAQAARDAADPSQTRGSLHGSR